jgi:toxin FitB
MPRGWLLDTNLLSETLRPRPDAQVMAWMQAIDTEKCFVSVLTLGELRKGVLKLTAGKQRSQLAHWLDHTLVDWFGERVITIDQAVCSRWAELLVAAGRPLPAIDSLLAASAAAHDLVVATRNVSDFDLLGVVIVNPWDAP